MSEQDAVLLWEDNAGDSGESPTPEELRTFARAVADRTLEDAASDWPKHQWANMGKGTVQQIAVWLRERKTSDE